MTTTNLIKSIGASDIDTKELVTNLVNATKEPRQKIIDKDKRRAELAISSLGLLKSALSTLQNTATEIGSVSKLNQVSLSSTNSDAVSAKKSGTGVAREGSYSVVVDKLALTDRKTLTLATATPLAMSESDPKGSITISRTVDDEEITATIAFDDPSTTPSSIVSAINANETVRSLNVRATVITTGISATPYAIVLESDSGEANQFSVGTSTLNSFVQDPARTGRDATLTVNGVEIKRSTNKITDAISGITLNLTKEGESADITVTNDSSALIEKVQNFVESFNLTREFLVKATGQPVEGDDIAGSLKSDVNARGILNKLRTKLINQSSSFSGAVTHWSSLGVSFNRDGKLEFDSSKFTAAFDANPEDAITALSSNASTPRIFASDTVPSGLAGDIARIAYQMNKSTGVVSAMTKGFETRLTSVEKRQTSLDAYIERLTDQYDRQFTALNAALAAFKNTQSQLERSLNLKNDN